MMKRFKVWLKQALCPHPLRQALVGQAKEIWKEKDSIVATIRLNPTVICPRCGKTLKNPLYK